MSEEINEEFAPSEEGDAPFKDRLSAEEMRDAKKIIDLLISKGIRVLALDFDKTIVDVHTAGFWRQGTHKLADHVRTCFEALIRAALPTDLHLCIVTYSMQPNLIRDVLRVVMPRSNTRKILIRANSKDWLPQQSGPNAPSLGKQQHIAWICTELFNAKHDIVHPQEILLMDDDEENVNIAHQFGHQAYEVPDDVSLDALWKYASTMSEVHHDLLDVEPGKRTSFIKVS